MSDYNSRFGGFSLFPQIIKNLLVINGTLFFLTFISKGLSVDGESLYSVIMHYLALNPLGYSFMPWQLVTYQFLHGNFSHILFNMLALWMFGMEIEELWGPKRFLLFYLAAGVGGGLVQLIMSALMDGRPAPTIGASGAIFGVMIAFALMFPDRYVYVYFLIPVKAKYLIGFMIIFNLLAVNDDGGGVAYLCHIGGALTGFFYMMFDSGINFDLKQTLMSGNVLGGMKTNRNKFPSAFSPGPSSPRVEDANFYDINSKKQREDTAITQADIDEILDKISSSGYKSLSDHEKRILFEASKRG